MGKFFIDIKFTLNTTFLVQSRFPFSEIVSLPSGTSVSLKNSVVEEGDFFSREYLKLNSGSIEKGERQGVKEGRPDILTSVRHFS